MEEPNLDELRARLNTVQCLAVSHLFQERNAVEVMAKLQQKGMVEALHSLDGTEYITTAALQREIAAELQRSEGRLNLWDVSPLLNVEGGQVQAAVQRMLKDQPELLLIGGDLLAPCYFDGVAREVAELLRQSGRISLVDLAARFRLPLSCVTDALRSRMDALSPAVLEDGALYTPAFLQQHCRSLKGALRAAAYPSSLLEVAARHALPDKLLPTVLQMLLDEGELPGLVEGGHRGLFIPNRFEAARRRAACDFYRENSYMNYERLRGWGVTNPAQYMQRVVCRDATSGEEKGAEDRGSDEGLPLSSHFVATSLMHSLTLQVEALALAQPCIPLACLLPMELDDRDTEEVWRWCRAASPPLAQQWELHRSHLVQPAVLRPLVLQAVERAAETDVRKGLRMAGPHFTASGTAEPQRRAGRDRRSAGSGRDRDVGDIEIEVAKATAIGQAALPAAAQPSEPFAEALATSWLHEISAVYVARAQRLSLGPAELRRTQRSALQQEMDVLWQDLHLYRRGLASFARHGNAEADHLLEEHLLTTVGARLVRCLVLDNALGNGESPDPDAPTDKLLTLFPKPQRAALSELLDASTGGSVPRFVAEVERLQSSCDVCLRMWDKRRERQHQQRRRRELVEQLFDGRNSGRHLWLTAGLCLYARFLHAVLWAPPAFARHLLPALAELRQESPPAPRLLQLLAEAELEATELQTGGGQTMQPLRSELVQFFRADDGL